MNRNLSRNLLPVFVFLAWIAGSSHLVFAEENDLHRAIKAGNMSLAKSIIHKNTVGDLNAQDAQGNTPLNLACAHRHCSTAKLLLSKNANVNIVNQDGNSPLMYAARECSLDVVTAVVRAGASVQNENKGKNTALFWAAEAGSDDTVNYLITQKAVVDHLNESNNTPLMWAARAGKDSTIKLLAWKGANLNNKNYEDRTPLSWAAREGHLSTVQVLLKLGADPTMVDREKRFTAADWAKEKGHLSTARLLQYGVAVRDATNLDEIIRLKSEIQNASSPEMQSVKVWLLDWVKPKETEFQLLPATLEKQKNAYEQMQAQIQEAQAKLESTTQGLKDKLAELSRREEELRETNHNIQCKRDELAEVGEKCKRVIKFTYEKRAAMAKTHQAALEDLIVENTVGKTDIQLSDVNLLPTHLQEPVAATLKGLLADVLSSNRAFRESNPRPNIKVVATVRVKTFKKYWKVKYQVDLSIASEVRTRFGAVNDVSIVRNFLFDSKGKFLENESSVAVDRLNLFYSDSLSDAIQSANSLDEGHAEEAPKRLKRETAKRLEIEELPSEVQADKAEMNKNDPVQNGNEVNQVLNGPVQVRAEKRKTEAEPQPSVREAVLE